MGAIELKDGIVWTGVLDPNLRVFDIIMKTEFGTTYNSYLIKGSKKTALIDTAKLDFFDSYLKTIESLTAISEIDYIIMNHTEPDHAGSIEKLIEINPNIVIVATGVAISFLKEIINKEFSSITIKDNVPLSLGNKTLRFMSVPNLHWPDTMFTYIEEDKVIFTCDSFGAHYSSDDILRSKVANEYDYQFALKYYFDNIIGPFKNPFMVNALIKMEKVDIECICTGHGPVIDKDIQVLLLQYRTWCEVKNPNLKKTVIIPYVSAYGYTKQLALAIRDGIRASGPIDVRCYDLVDADIQKVHEELSYADGMLFGTPTILSEALEPILNITSSLHSVTHANKLASAFGSYGWSGEGVPHVIERLKQVRLNVMEGFRVRFKPNETNLKDAFDFGYNFGCVLLDKKNDKLQIKSSSQVKCLICGAILDASEEICPVCGVGKENFVGLDDLVLTHHVDTRENFVILGGGAAAYHAAREIRFRNDTCKIIMISNEAYPPYNRPMLTKSMVSNFDENQLLIENATWYKNNKVNLRCNTTVQEIDPKKKEVILKGGETIKYDKCIYALGSTCFVPPIEGYKLPEVIAIRNIDDIKKIISLSPIQHVVVIGGGVLGLEAAWQLQKAKSSVCVLELLPQLMPWQLDEGASDILRKECAKNSIELHTGVKITKIIGTTKVEGVELEDGTVIPAELILVSAGVRANTDIASQCGMDIGRAIRVNEKMETSIPDIYAAGDCAEFESINFALWSEAVEMGKVAGANATGDTLKYEQALGALSFFGLNTSLYALGDTGKNPERKYKTVEVRDNKVDSYEKLYFFENHLCGFIIIKDLKRMKELTECYLEKKCFSEVMSI